MDWPLHDIDIANLVLCMAYKKSGRGRVVYGAIVLQ